MRFGSPGDEFRCVSIHVDARYNADDIGILAKAINCAIAQGEIAK